MLIETTTYDVKGKRIDNAYYVVDGNDFPGREEYKYDRRGNITEMIRRDSHSSILSKEVYTYEFDTVGNWIKMTTSLVLFEAGKLIYEPVEATYRTITYYFNGTVAKKVSPPSISKSVPVGSSAKKITSERNTESKASAKKAVVSRSDTAVQNQSALKPTAAAPDLNNTAEGPLTGSGKEVEGEPMTEADAEPPASSTPKPSAMLVSGKAHNGRLISLPTPHYPEKAKRAGASGTVTVEVVIDKTGKVISAHAVSGHPLLQPAAVEAARQAQFSPILFSGQQAQVVRLITYTFSSVP